MNSFGWFRILSPMRKTTHIQDHLILPSEDQVSAWHKANKKMSWGIKKEEFDTITLPPSLTERERDQGFMGFALFYGFGDDGSGNADSVLSGKKAWDYYCSQKKGKFWKSEYINFDASDAFRLRPGAPLRPRGFYFAQLKSWERVQHLSVSRMRGRFNAVTGCGPEGFQFLCISHTHCIALMNERKTPFMALADYDVAPYGYNDFFDVPQLFCSNGILGLGIGNVDRNYQGFGIPALRF